MTNKRCLRCAQQMEYKGHKKFREGTNWGIMGEIGEWFEGSEELHMYVCPMCGYVEFSTREN